MLTLRKIFALALMLIPCSFSNGLNGTIDNEKLDSRIRGLIEKYNIPDADIAIIQNDSIIYKFSNNPAKEQGNYYIGSCSKSFTALTILMLSEKGLIDLDSPVAKYLPWFRLKNPGKSSQITVRHLLNQTSGIESQYGFFDYKTDDPEIFQTKLLKHLSTIDVLITPGESFNYCNLNYLLLGMVTEAVTKEKFGQALSENVLQKIGLKNTYTGFGEEVLSRTVQPYQYLFMNKPSGSHIYPHSGLSASFGFVSSDINDLMKYLKFMINKGVTENGDTLLSEAGYEKLITPVKGNYAMGWTEITYNDIKMLLHTGLDENYSAILAIYPEYRMGVAVLCNINSLEFSSLVQSSTIDLLVGKPFMEPPFSLDILLRWGTAIILLFTIALLILNFFRWKKYNFKTGFLLKFLPVLRLLLGIFLSIGILVLVRVTYNIPLASMVDFQPDIAWALILTALLGTVSSVIRYLGTSAKLIVLRG